MNSIDSMPFQPVSASQARLLDDDSVALKFLKCVLPSTGVYCAAIKTKHKFRNEFQSTIDGLWNVLREADRSGHEVYFSVASLLSNANREADNVQALKCFRIDVDYGEGHKGQVYATKDEAVAAVRKFYADASLPCPLIVMSGGGLHVYWPLETPLPRVEWLRYATGLKAACIALELKADHAITADAARILRAPCTTNRKLPGKPRKVEVDPRFLEIEPYELAKFEPLLHYKLAAPGGRVKPTADRKVIPFPLHPLPDYLKSRPSTDLLRKLAAGIGYDPADAEMIANQCAQLRAMRDTGGLMPEPAWKACIGILAFCEDGEACTHEWSKGDERYDANETQRKFAACGSLTGPTRCEHFYGLDDETRARCEACPHKGKISSPIHLGTYAAPPLAKAKGVLIPAPKPLIWELTEKGARRTKSYPNTVLAIEALGIKGRHDVFHDRKLVTGDLAENLGPELSDAITRAMRDEIIAAFSFDPGKDNVHEALERLCESNRFDPVADYLDSLQWDGAPRLDRWLITHMGAEDTPLNRAFSRKTLIAGVRRVRQPGCKFDFMLVLEGAQGVGKSRAVQILAGSKENFSDQPIKWDDPKQQHESVGGIWIYEMGELVGLRKTDVENIKNFLSRQADNVRPAYGRHRVERPRRCVFIGTVNGGKKAGYLTDPSGARRFWPVEVSSIDLEALRRDRDQLWAEAAAIEPKGEELSIDCSLYEAAAAQQELRRAPDGWTDILAGVTGTRFESPDGTIERISTSDLLLLHLNLQAAQVTHTSMIRLGSVMRGLGWLGPKDMRLAQKGSGQQKGTPVVKGYERPAKADPDR